MLDNVLYGLIFRAGRSGEDRYLGMVEASGSIPDQSTTIFVIYFK